LRCIQRRCRILIVLEGIDGSGKSTQARRLSEALDTLKVKNTAIRPVYFLYSQLKRDGADAAALSPRTVRINQFHQASWGSVRLGLLQGMGVLYAYATYALLRYYSRRSVIICDRYFYQFFFDIYRENALHVALNFPPADITFFLDAELDVLHPRMTAGKDREHPKEYYSQAITYYQTISARLGFIRIDATREEAAIHQEILSIIHSRLQG
jgi:thymidylate kinase